MMPQLEVASYDGGWPYQSLSLILRIATDPKMKMQIVYHEYR
jgi:hypothetical protein